MLPRKNIFTVLTTQVVMKAGKIYHVSLTRPDSESLSDLYRVLS